MVLYGYLIQICFGLIGELIESIIDGLDVIIIPFELTNSQLFFGLFCSVGLQLVSLHFINF